MTQQKTEGALKPCRDAFEKWFMSRPHAKKWQLKKNNGEYDVATTMPEWGAFQAAWNQRTPSPMPEAVVAKQMYEALKREWGKEYGDDTNSQQDEAIAAYAALAAMMPYRGKR